MHRRARWEAHFRSSTTSRSSIRHQWFSSQPSQGELPKASPMHCTQNTSNSQTQQCNPSLYNGTTIQKAKYLITPSSHCEPVPLPFALSLHETNTYYNHRTGTFINSEEIIVFHSPVFPQELSNFMDSQKLYIQNQKHVLLGTRKSTVASSIIGQPFDNTYIKMVFRVKYSLRFNGTSHECNMGKFRKKKHQDTLFWHVSLCPSLRF